MCRRLCHLHVEPTLIWISSQIRRRRFYLHGTLKECKRNRFVRFVNVEGRKGLRILFLKRNRSGIRARISQYCSAGFRRIKASSRSPSIIEEQVTGTSLQYIIHCLFRSSTRQPSNMKGVGLQAGITGTSSKSWKSMAGLF